MGAVGIPNQPTLSWVTRVLTSALHTYDVLFERLFVAVTAKVLGALLAIVTLAAFVIYYTSKNSDKSRTLPQGLGALHAMAQADPDFVASRRKPSAEEAALVGLPQLKDDPDIDVSEEAPQMPGSDQTDYLLASSKKTGQVASLDDESES